MLLDKLTKSMQKSVGWRDLANALSELNSKVSDRVLTRASGLPSVFQMEDADLKIRLDELGEFFRFGDFGDEDRAMVIQQRQDELHLKDTLYPLKKTLAREMFGAEVEWAPLYSNVNKPYGVDFRTVSSINDIENWWLTSRGVLRVNVASLPNIKNLDITVLNQVSESIKKLARPIIPLHIVYDGVVFYVRTVVKERKERARFIKIDVITHPNSTKEPATHIRAVSTAYSHLTAQYFSLANFDEFGLDDVPLDSMVSRAVKERVNGIKVNELTKDKPSE